MLRVWLFSALGVGLVVAAVLVFTGRGKRPPAQDNASPGPPSPLQRREIEIYLKVWPEVARKLGEEALHFQRKRLSSTAPNPPAESADPQVITALLEQHHLSREGFDALRSRIWYAVEVLRWEAEAKQRNDDLEARIQEKEQLLELAGKGKLRREIRADIAALGKQRLSKGPPLLDADRRLIRSYWKALAPLVPEFAGKPKRS